MCSVCVCHDLICKNVFVLWMHVRIGALSERTWCQMQSLWAVCWDSSRWINYFCLFWLKSAPEQDPQRVFHLVATLTAVQLLGWSSSAAVCGQTHRRHAQVCALAPSTYSSFLINSSFSLPSPLNTFSFSRTISLHQAQETRTAQTVQFCVLKTEGLIS